MRRRRALLVMALGLTCVSSFSTAEAAPAVPGGCQASRPATPVTATSCTFTATDTQGGFTAAVKGSWSIKDTTTNTVVKSGTAPKGGRLSTVKGHQYTCAIASGSGTLGAGDV
jgi:hypothetical protein